MVPPRLALRVTRELSFAELEARLPRDESMPPRRSSAPSSRRWSRGSQQRRPRGVRSPPVECAADLRAPSRSPISSPDAETHLSHDGLIAAFGWRSGHATPPVGDLAAGTGTPGPRPIRPLRAQSTGARSGPGITGIQLSRRRSRRGLFEDEDCDVVSVVLAAAADLREDHRAELASADHDLDGVAIHARQAALCE